MFLYTDYYLLIMDHENFFENVLLLRVYNIVYYMKGFIPYTKSGFLFAYSVMARGRGCDTINSESTKKYIFI
jgi:hypothetical protein